MSRRKPSYPQDTNAGASPSSPSSFPGGPPVSGQTVYYKGQDGSGAAVAAQDSSGNGHHASAVSTAIHGPHPLLENFFTKWDIGVPTFPDTGVVAPLECSFECYFGFNSVDVNVYYGETGKDLIALRKTGTGFLLYTTTWISVGQVFTNNTWPIHAHVRRVAGALPGDAKLELFCNGRLVYTSADFTPLASGTTGRIVPSSTNLFWSHISFWTTPKTDDEIKTQASYFT